MASAISRRSLLGSLALLPPQRAGAAQRKNVLFIIVDDLNTELGCYGSPNVRTPNIDRLARSGVRFDSHHCQFPLCQPSRASALSGRRPDTTKVYTLNTPTRVHMPDAVFLPEYFRQNGYYAAHSGKVYHTGNRAEDPRSWDEETREFGKTPPPEAVIRKFRAEGLKYHTFEWDILNLTDAEMPDGMVARRGVAYIEKAIRENRRFFVGVGFRRPHSPYAAPKRHFDNHPWQNTSLPHGSPEDFRRLLKAAVNYPPLERPLTEQQVREFRAAYFSCVDFVDAQVGIVLDAMDRHRLWENTVVVFTVDHGYHLGDHGGLWHKLSLFENSTRIPLIVYAPGARGNGRACRRLTEGVDLYPTLAELCGLDRAAGMEGSSFVPLLEDPARPWKRGAYSMVGRGEAPGEAPEKISYFGRTVRTERWRYTEWDDGKQGLELYDHSADAGEQNNLAETPQSVTIRKELATLLHEGWRSALP
jgi:iduronate 2-sulfatase